MNMQIYKYHWGIHFKLVDCLACQLHLDKTVIKNCISKYRRVYWDDWKKMKALRKRQQIVSFSILTICRKISQFFFMESAERTRGFIKLWKILINTLSEFIRTSQELMHSLKWLLKWITWRNYTYLPKSHDLGQWQLRKQLYCSVGQCLWGTYSLS